MPAGARDRTRGLPGRWRTHRFRPGSGPGRTGPWGGMKKAPRSAAPSGAVRAVQAGG
jgi:hypothetical protein